ncbi:MAG: hypothetical protein CL581_16895 [Alteromonadaceae bacterium]|uniref:DUF6316 family protein n=1 Tax=unclassified Marinobacter TaxID=83889 RepID=UPI000C532477|nr:DUF6316 family protein [Marinobacter sp. BGYM27]MAA66436.1 hypothetical protein [Alteromonadaceae bacterium]MBH85293.1 hypothetical protein [Alteromonadaceae bacterium]MDG5499840.1 DUF6316 family protein [Marinobacter sp. BGYM27]
MAVRHGERDRNWFRTERFSYVNSEWYFETREGSIEGPFETPLEAELELNHYLRVAQSMPGSSGKSKDH